MKDSNNDPRFSVERCQQLAEDIETYFDTYTNIFVIPEPKDHKIEKNIMKSIETVNMLIAKLKKGKSSVFKDPDEVESLDWLRQTI